MTSRPFVLDPSRIRDVTPEVLDPAGRIRVLPAAYWAGTTREERVLFGHRHGIYSFPTVELVDHLRALIGDRTAIEIGAGHGGLAAALDIPATDNRQQEMPRYKAIYQRMGQPPVRYGPNVTAMAADTAVRTYAPQVVIGCWVTHLYDPARHHAGGNEIGVDEADVIANCGTYVLVGNDNVHQHKAIWDLPHSVDYPPFLYSRGRGRDFIATWTAGGRR